MKKFMKYALMSLAIAMVFVATEAFATGSTAVTGSSSNVFTTITTRMAMTFRNSRSVIFIVGGFGLIGLGFAAIFGKVNWKWLAALACGLAIVAVAGQVVDYVTRQDTASHFHDAGGKGMVDTLTDNSSGYSTAYN